MKRIYNLSLFALEAGLFLPSAAFADGYSVGASAQTSADFNFFPTASYNVNGAGGVFSDQYQTVVPPNPPSTSSGNTATLTDTYETSGVTFNGVETTTYDPADQTAGSATSAFVTSMINDSRGDAASASGGADLSTGSLHVYAGSNLTGNCHNEQSCSQGTAQAFLSDTLHFQIAGANANTVTPITVSFTMDGSNAGDYFAHSASWVMGGSFGDAIFAHPRSYYGLAAYVPADGAGLTVDPTSFAPSGWASYTLNSLTADSVSFTGVYNLIGADPTEGLGLNFQATAGAGSVLDYSNTAGISLGLPTGVTYTSNSGVFLNGAMTPPGAVPEPATWALMLVGFGGIGLAQRRRRNALGLAKLPQLA